MLYSRLILLIVDLCVLYLQDLLLLIFKPVLGCVRNFSMGCIKIVHAASLPPQVCGCVSFVISFVVIN